jgi:murein DD-endopeptidase MepM/ murein hydrolase activator NlpD
LIRRLLARLLNWINAHPTRRRVFLIGLAVVLTALLYGGSWALRLIRQAFDQRSQALIRWFTGAEAEREALITTRREACPGAPFILPADGFIGLLYGDSRSPYSAAHPHQGIDIFSAEPPGVTPVYAAYDGYVTHETRWVSALIQRVPDDPLQPGRQIWLYYTHMANEAGTEVYIDEAFPPGVREVFVEQGTLLGYMGNYGGNRRVAVHLHFSIVLDNGSGGYANELDFDNTIDPSRYLGMAVNYACAPEVATCTDDPSCEDAILGRGGR